MITKRAFLKYTASYALGSLFFSCSTKDKTSADKRVGEAASSQTLGPIGIQLWSVKDVVEKDLKGTLQKIANLGYQQIESYPGQKGHYYGMEPAAFSDMLSGMGLNLVSSHFGSGTPNGQASSWREGTMLHGLERLVEKAAQTGQQYLTCSWMDESLRQTPDDLKRTADLFNRTGETCQKAGLQFAYHNHEFEFGKMGEGMIYDFMLQNTEPSLVQYEMDIYWVVAGGQDPVAYLKKYPNRFPLGHVKDMDKEDRTKNAVIGQGSIDYLKILKAAKDAGMQHFLVEQETFTQPSIDAMKEDYEYLSQVKV